MLSIMESHKDLEIDQSMVRSKLNLWGKYSLTKK
jgi:hypothetical protein